MKDWLKQLKYDPVAPLSNSRSQSILYFVRRDLLDGAREGDIEKVWKLPEVEKILKVQLDNGAWKYPGGRERIRSRDDYNQLETFRILGQLVEKHGLNKNHPAIRKAADYLFSHQSGEGDFRGIAGNQYVPYYSAGMMELLIKSGYGDDSRIGRGFQWLLSIRQQDGGWAFPLRTVGKKLDRKTFQSEPIHPDTSKPFSHLVTGVVLRAFAAHPDYRRSNEARLAASLLASRFFKADKYPDRRAPSFWTSFSYPFWFTDLLSSLDSISLIGLTEDDPQVRRALDWFVATQQKNGLWSLLLRTMAREKEPDSWISLAVSRVCRRLFG